MAEQSDGTRAAFLDGLAAAGDRLLAANQIPKAAETAERLVQLAPDTPLGFDLRGRIALKQRRFTTAEAAFREGLSRDPANWALHNNLGVALLAQKRRREAIAEFEQAYQINPAAAKARKNLFSATSAYVGAGGALVFFLAIHFLPEVERVLHLSAGVFDALFLGGLIAAIVGLWLLGRFRQRNLSPEVRAIYRRDVRRQRNLELARSSFHAGPPAAVVIVMVLVIAADPSVPGVWLAAGAAFVLLWLVFWKRLWNGITRSMAR